MIFRKCNFTIFTFMKTQSTEKMRKLREFIAQIISLTDEELLRLYAFLEIKSLPRNSLFLKEGEVCRSIAFVNEGALIYFKSLENGTEMTTDFAFEGEWVTNNMSRLSKTPSLLNIKAVENTELFIINDDDLTGLYLSMPKVERLGRVITEQAFVRTTLLSIDLQVLPAKERYERLLKRYPQIINRLPLYHIANYLGIAPKSLSRIRNEYLHKK